MFLNWRGGGTLGLNGKWLGDGLGASRWCSFNFTSFFEVTRNVATLQLGTHSAEISVGLPVAFCLTKMHRMMPSSPPSLLDFVLTCWRSPLR